MTETFLHSITEMPLLQKRRKQYMTAQNKETYLESMNEEYKQKHYPEGSVFKAHKKAMKGVNAGLGLFFMGAFLAGSIAGLVWSINRTLEIIRDKEENMLGGMVHHQENWGFREK